MILPELVVNRRTGFTQGATSTPEAWVQYQVSLTNYAQLVFDGFMIEDITLTREDFQAPYWMPEVIAIALAMWVWGKTSYYKYPTRMVWRSEDQRDTIFHVCLDSDLDHDQAKHLMFWMRSVEAVYHLRPGYADIKNKHWINSKF